MSKILQEKYLHGEFKFGFELEAYVNPYQIPTIPESDYWNEIDDFQDEDPNDYWNMGKVIESMWDTESYQEELEGLYKFDDVKEEAKKCINKYFPEEADWIIKPSSGVCYDGSLGLCGFEWPSPTMKFTPSAIAQCIHLLTHLQDESIETDEKCGFHVHISSPSMTLEEAKWIVMNIAMSDEYITLLTIFDDVDYYGEFFGSYAKKDFLYKLRESFENNDFDNLKLLLDNEKYRVLRIHPQGTLEWRGPREFIGENTKAIKDFFVRLYSVISMFIEIMEKQTIGDYSKDNFLNMISSPNVDFNISKNKTKYEKLLHQLIQKPLILSKIQLPNSVIRVMSKMVVHLPSDNLVGYEVIANAVKECVVSYGKVVPENILLAVLSNPSQRKNIKQDIIKHLVQPYPIKEVIYNLKRNYPQVGESWRIMQVLDYIDCFDTNDIITIINEYPDNMKTFANDFIDEWKLRVKSPIPQKIKNVLIQKLSEKGIDFDINSKL